MPIFLRAGTDRDDDNGGTTGPRMAAPTALPIPETTATAKTTIIGFIRK